MTQSVFTPTTSIANLIRRTTRLSGNGSKLRKRIREMHKSGFSASQMYIAGLADGQKSENKNLADVLYSIQLSGLGRAAAIEESNSHIRFRVQECLCCQPCESKVCEFTAGFLAGAMLATKKFLNVDVKEVLCGEYPGNTCVFVAELKSRR
jgi:predicted hydrocarbon binding protein